MPTAEKCLLAQLVRVQAGDFISELWVEEVLAALVTAALRAWQTPSSPIRCKEMTLRWQATHSNAFLLYQRVLRYLC
jgi:hypothetical protein